MSDWNKLKVTELKGELKKRGLLLTGNKATLVARLAEADANRGNNARDGSTEYIEDEAEDASVPLTSANNQSPTPRVSVPKEKEQSLQNTVMASEDESMADNRPSISEAANVQAADEKAYDNSAVETSAEVPMASTQDNAIGKPAISESHAFRPTDRISSTYNTMMQPSIRTDSVMSIDPQEVYEDRQKRKRRSQSPPPSSTAMSLAHKRQRYDEEAGVSMSTSVEDAYWVAKHNHVNSAEINASAKEVPPKGLAQGSTIVDDSREEITVIEADNRADTDVEMPLMDQKQDPESATMVDERSRESRFRDLFVGTDPATVGASYQEDIRNEETERIIAPAIHPATSALYIRNFMRPLNPQTVQNHFTTLATPRGQSPDSSIILNCYLDSIRTHALISFANVSAASRVRSAIHDRIWPDERNRKSLWADFIPSEKVDHWIAEEQNSQAGGRSVKKYEVIYDEDENSNIIAMLQETGGPPNRQASLGKPIQPPPSGPSRGVESAPLGPRAGRAPPYAANILMPDTFFRRTDSEPPIYWQPVSRDLSTKRLDQIDDVTSRKYDGQGGGEINRYTFEDRDILVDRGPEIFSGIRPPPGFRGPRGNGPRGGMGGGGYSSRGAMGGYRRSGGIDGSWRGDFGHDDDSYRGARRDRRY